MADRQVTTWNSSLMEDSIDISIAAQAKTKPDVSAQAGPRPAAPIDIASQVREAAKPARVDFHIETKMLMGEAYEARLEVLRPGTKPIFGGGVPPAVSQQVQILDRVGASLQATRLNVHPLSEPWQEVPLGARGLWMWRIEPLQAGTANLVVMVQHRGRLGDQDTTWTVEHFPRTVTVEVTALHQFKSAVRDVADALGTVSGAVSALGTIGMGLAGVMLWVRGRRPEKNAQT